MLTDVNSEATISGPLHSEVIPQCYDSLGAKVEQSRRTILVRTMKTSLFVLNFGGLVQCVVGSQRVSAGYWFTHSFIYVFIEWQRSKSFGLYDGGDVVPPGK